MFLRDHPLMNYRGNRSWPPAWLRTAGNDTSGPRGDLGVMTARSRAAHPAGCYLAMAHCGAEYVGALLLVDRAFCRQIFEILLQSVGKTIQEIGDIELSYGLWMNDAAVSRSC